MSVFVDTAPAAFEIVDLERGGVVYISDDPPDACSGYGEPCGGCDECRWRQAGPSYARRPARPWVAWPGWDACAWCGLGRAGGERCERCNEPRETSYVVQRPTDNSNWFNSIVNNTLFTHTRLLTLDRIAFCGPALVLEALEDES